VTETHFDKKLSHSLNLRFAPCTHSESGERIAEAHAAMRRFLPHSLVFLAAHILFIGASIAVAAFH
jgi:hypothetical protein